MGNIIAIAAVAVALALPVASSAQSYGNNYGFDPSIQRRTQEMQQQQMQQMEAQRMHQDRMMQQQQMQQSIDQTRQQQHWDSMNNNVSRPYRY
ncbi:hypothetical protein SAMN05216428_102395 [Nitrosospira sp. Nsp11]|uniref:hypothetical protein n=1 Tax=Nitrosospira sp. Nsp11 TaxID=1855338 RepID=UPI0009108212|nr:hypothetical protein [Nitrosospira sp. Nsp11]SHL43405.1 hypothetical protein SAMN05216428_102395 [Nitrosospira sp. Nsp11]